MNSALEQLKKMTVVVADTGDFRSIEQFRPRDATTNPSLILAASDKADYADLIEEALAFAVACAEGGITLISPFVGRIFDYYKKERGVDSIPSAEDPGAHSVQEIYSFFKNSTTKPRSWAPASATRVRFWSLPAAIYSPSAPTCWRNWQPPRPIRFPVSFRPAS